MTNGFRTRLLFVVLPLVGLAVIPGVAGCSSPVPVEPIQQQSTLTDEIITPSDNISIPARGFYMGILPTPAAGQDFEAAYKEAAEYAEFVPVWGRPTPFYNIATELYGSWGQNFVEGYIRENGMFPLIHLSFIDYDMRLAAPPGMSDATLADPEWREAYKKAALNAAKVSKPKYMSLGNEVNRWYEHYGANESNFDGFQHYVSLYHEIYDAVKAVSPETVVFCTFAREIVAENRETDLAVLGMFKPDKMDMLVFTSYPYAVQGINRPQDIPDDYYSRALSDMPAKPFGFSELGWAALDAFGGEQAQADFINQAVTRLTREQGIDLKLFGWAWLHGQDDNDPVALIKRDGTPRQAYATWQSISISGE